MRVHLRRQPVEPGGLPHYTALHGADGGQQCQQYQQGCREEGEQQRRDEPRPRRPAARAGDGIRWRITRPRSPCRRRRR